ncbi:MAG: aldo/keto reductase [Chloroflexi bacterium]|nr:aldo/keto reductase [Chloroflexota bacterium]
MMEFRQPGHSGLEVSAFSLGSWLTYEFMDEQEALAVIAKGLEAGINFLDDARYNDRAGTAPLKTGYSEVLFGRLLRKGGWHRANLVIANKLWYEFYPEESPEAELDGSLSRLQMDYIDLLYCNPPPASLPIVELVKQMDDLIKTGKIRYWGVVNWPVEKIEEAYNVATTEGLSSPCAAQLRYSLLETSPVEDEPTRQLCRSGGIGIVASYSLYGGLLSGKYHQSDVAIKGRFGAEAVEAMRQKGLLDKVKRVISLAQEVGCTPAQLALAYCLRNDLVSSLLFGATKVAQVEDNLRTLEILPRINQEVMTRLHIGSSKI